MKGPTLVNSVEQQYMLILSKSDGNKPLAAATGPET